jgi:hypothetical protein
MLEKCVESAHGILYVLRNGQAFLSMLGKAPSKPTKASLAMRHNGLGACPFHNTLRSQKIHLQERFWSLWTSVWSSSEDYFIVLWSRNDIICHNVIIFLTTLYGIIFQWWSYTHFLSITMYLHSYLAYLYIPFHFHVFNYLLHF